MALWGESVTGTEMLLWTSWLSKALGLIYWCGWLQRRIHHGLSLPFKAWVKFSQAGLSSLSDALFLHFHCMSYSHSKCLMGWEGKGTFPLWFTVDSVCTGVKEPGRGLGKQLSVCGWSGMNMYEPNWFPHLTKVPKDLGALTNCNQLIK